MIDPAADPEMRVLVLAPTERDAMLTKAVFDNARLRSVCFTSLKALCDALSQGAGVVFVPEEIITSDEHHRLAAWIAAQPPWSDLPVLVLAQQGADSSSVARAMNVLGNVTVLERPMRVAALVSVARSALRARQRQYQIREHLIAREQAAAALISNDRRKDEFLAILAHELRNPLAPIRNSLYILRHVGSSVPELSQIGDMMERQVNHMVRLVDDLLEISRITRDKIELRRERIPVTQIVETALEASRPLMEQSRHELSVDIPDQPMFLDADPVRLAQVVANLLNNAAKYTDPGGHIRLRAGIADDAVTISVRDDGTGIAAEVLPHVFELFVQADQNSERVQGGLGIGLTLVKRLVEMHGGTVSATSDGPGKGSEFTVRLPLAESPSVQNGDGHVAVPAGPAPRRVLVVDDNVDAADSLGALLELLGIETRVVYGGVDAIEALPAFEPAVVLLDIGMPGMDGHEVARRIRQRPDGKRFKIIAMTGWGQEEDRRRTEAAGFDYHLIKPADVEELEALLYSLDAPHGGTSNSGGRTIATA